MPGFEGFYEVSEFGRVRSLTVLRNHGGYRPRVIPGRLLRAKTTSVGYQSLTLWGKDGHTLTERLHVLVALAFVPNPMGLPIVRHKDDCKMHSVASNLIWGSYKDNARDARINGRIPVRKLTVEQARALKQRLRDELGTLMRRRDGGLDKRLGAEFNVSGTTVGMIRKGITWAHV